MGKYTAMSVLVFFASVAAADAQDATRWGVSASFVPAWQIVEQLSDVLVAVDRDAESSTVAIRGSEFRVGFVRGRDLGGDWGVSLVRKRLRDSHATQMDRFVVPDRTGRFLQEVPFGFDYDLNEVTLTGIEYHRFRPFATIRERVQIGLTYGVGVGWFGGRVRGVEFDETGATAVERRPDALFEGGDVGLLSIMDYTLKPTPLAKAELSVATLIVPGLKLRASGGFNFPGYEIGGISLVYLFGSR